MKCEICSKNEATVHFKQVYEGEVREMFVCEECAAQNGFDVQSPMSLTDFLFGVGVEAKKESVGEDKACPACAMRRSDFQKTSRLGCPKCYETFEEDLIPLLEVMHKGTRHIGKIPAGEKMASQIAALQRALDKAISTQDFEEAAQLRDKIHELKANTPKASGAEDVETLKAKPHDHR